jgi:hypothetical protein
LHSKRLLHKKDPGLLGEMVDSRLEAGDVQDELRPSLVAESNTHNNGGVSKGHQGQLKELPMGKDVTIRTK